VHRRSRWSFRHRLPRPPGACPRAAERRGRCQCHRRRPSPPRSCRSCHRHRVCPPRRPMIWRRFVRTRAPPPD